MYTFIHFSFQGVKKKNKKQKKKQKTKKKKKHFQQKATKVRGWHHYQEMLFVKANWKQTKQPNISRSVFIRHIIDATGE